MKRPFKIIISLFIFGSIFSNILIRAQVSESALDNLNVEKLLSVIESQIENQQWPQAEENIIGLMKLEPAHPRNFMLFFNLGVCCYNQNKLEDALQYFDIVLTKDPAFLRALYRRALTFIALKENTKAITDLTSVLMHEPQNQDALFLRSLLNYEIGNAPEAKSDIEDLLVITGDNVNYETLLLGARIYASLKEHATASNLYEKAMMINPDTETFVELIFYYIFEGDNMGRAQQLIHQAINNHWTDGRFFLGQALICRKNFLNSEMEENLKLAKKYGIDSQTIDYFLNKN